jgi:hypothetical protein
LQNAGRWKNCTIASILEKVDKVRRNSNVPPKNPAARVLNPAGAAKQRHATLPTATNDGAGPSRQVNGRLKSDSPVALSRKRKESEESQINKIRAALKIAGYPFDIIAALIKEVQFTYKNQATKSSTSRGFHWCLRLPNNIQVRAFKDILKNPHPGGKIIRNPLCEVAGCTRRFAHDGLCLINHAEAGNKRKYGDDNEEAKPSPSGINRKRRVQPLRSGGAQEVFVKDSTTSVVVECGIIQGEWSPFNPSLFKVTHGLPASEMPGELINGNTFERLGGKSHVKNWRVSIRVQLPNDVTMGLGAYMAQNNILMKPRLEKAPSTDWPPEEVKAAIAKKKESLRLMLAQAHYPPAIIEQLLTSTRFKSETNADGKLLIKYIIRLPGGVSTTTDEGILQNPYCLGGGGMSGGMYAFQSARKGRSKIEIEESSEEDDEESDSDEDEEAANDVDADGGVLRACATTTHCSLQAGHVGRCETAPSKVVQLVKQEGKQVEEAGTQEEFVIYLATTEEEDNVEEEGEDYTSSSSSEEQNDGGPSRLGNLTAHARLRNNLPSIERTRALIRAMLGYCGYPSDVIEDLLKHKLTTTKRSECKTLYWSLRLPNGFLANRYYQIEANPYPGGKITEKSKRTCPYSHLYGNFCGKAFGHVGPCSLLQSRR